MTYSICMPTVARPYRTHLFRRLVDTGTLEHPLVRGFHLAYGRGPNDNSDHALRQALTDETDYIIFLEDDVEIIDDLIGSIDRWMHDVRCETVHFYSIGCGVRRAMRHARSRGEATWRWPLKDYFGACGLVFPRASAHAFCDAYAARPTWMREWNGLDENLKRWHRRHEPTQTYILTPTTCFIDHRGTISSHPTDDQHWTGQYESFAGTTWRYESPSCA